MSPLECAQVTFCQFRARFVTELFSIGYQVTEGESYRSPQTCELYAKEGKGILHSNHELRLAWDGVLRMDGVLLPFTVEAYRRAGELWKDYSNDEYTCCWGGDFKAKPDCDHFSFLWNGIR